jgi:D-glycero-D-manno-heptose 1,7-bisphosphate phosphatase
MAHRAVFLDRDGVINEILYFPDMGRIDTPFHVDQFKLLPQVGSAVRQINELGFKVVVASNQPGIARNNFDEGTLTKIDARMRAEIGAAGGVLDAIYYCRHHSEGVNPKYRIDCDCRKPKPGLLLQAARDLDLDLASSYMVGDGLNDIQAGAAAGCKTILLGRRKCDLCRFMEDMGVAPDRIVLTLQDAVKEIQRGGF